MELSKQHGKINHIQLGTYLPNDIENLNQFMIKYQTKLDYTLSTELNKFIYYLVEYNQTINSMHMGMAKILNEYESNIKSSIDEYVEQVDILAKEIE